MYTQHRGRVRLAAPFDFELSCRWGCARAPGLEDWDGRAWRRSAWIAGRAVRLALRSRGVIDRPEVEWQLEAGEAPAAAVETLVREMLADDLDLGGFYTAVHRDAAWRRLCAGLTGLRGPRAASLWEAVAVAILTPEAVERVREAIGREGAFPEAATVAARPEVVRGLAPARAARALLAAARALREPRFSAASLRELGGEAAMAPLLAIEGVGTATAARALAWGVGHADVAPMTDRRLLEGARKMSGLRLPLTAAGVQRQWRWLEGWRGIAAVYCVTEELPS